MMYFILKSNNPAGRSMLCQTYTFPVDGVREIQSLMHVKLRFGGPTFDNGDDVSILVVLHDF